MIPFYRNANAQSCPHGLFGQPMEPRADIIGPDHPTSNVDDQTLFRTRILSVLGCSERLNCYGLKACDEPLNNLMLTSICQHTSIDAGHCLLYHSKRHRGTQIILAASQGSGSGKKRLRARRPGDGAMILAHVVQRLHPLFSEGHRFNMVVFAENLVLQMRFDRRL